MTVSLVPRSSDKLNEGTTFLQPFATRTTIARSLKGLQDVLPIVVVNSVMDPTRKSWTFSPKPLEDRPEVGIPGTVPEPLHGAPDLRALYEKSEGPMDGPYVVRPIYLFTFLD